MLNVFHDYLSLIFPKSTFFLKNYFKISNSLDPDKTRHFVGSDLGPSCLKGYQQMKASAATSEKGTEQERLERGVSCADPERFVRGGRYLITSFSFLFLVDEGKENQNITINRPLSARQRKAI